MKNRPEKKLDRTAFKMHSVEDASIKVAYWRQQSDAEKIVSAYHLSLRAYGFDPQNEPKLDRSKFSARKQ